MWMIRGWRHQRRMVTAVLTILLLEIAISRMTLVSWTVSGTLVATLLAVADLLMSVKIALTLLAALAFFTFLRTVVFLVAGVVEDAY
jgi:hypothetical protein